MEEKLKNLLVREAIHAKIAAAARERGMTIQGLTERILRAWAEENCLFFGNNVASSKKGK